MKIFSKKRNTIWKDKKINDRKFPPILSQSVSFSIPDFFFGNNTLLQTWALEEAHWENLSSQTYYGILRFLADWHNVLKTFLVSGSETFYSRFISFTLFCFGGRTSLLLTVQGLDEGVSSLSEAGLEYCAGRTHKTQTALMGSCMCKIEHVFSRFIINILHPPQWS